MLIYRSAELLTIHSNTPPIYTRPGKIGPVSARTRTIYEQDGTSLPGERWSVQGPTRLPSQQPQITHRCVNSLVDVVQLHLLVGCVEVVVGEAKAHQNRGSVQHFAEEGDDGDGA